MPTNADPWSVAVVGAGPWGTYAVERLTALVRAGSFPRPFQLLVLEASGNFGCGRVHHDQQTESSQLNRVASQIAFAADETVSNILLPSRLRPTMAEWASEKFTQTGNDRYQLESTDIPSRALHGEALRDAFNTYVTALRDVPRVDVRLIAARADRLTPRVDGRVDLGAGPLLWTVNHVLLTTGHGAVDLAPYPLREYLDGTVPTIALEGMGLTSIDVILALTEGRDGTFEAAETPTGLSYHPAGAEPARIFPFSRSGHFASARPRNDKALDPTGRGHAAQQLTGRHLTENNVNTLLARSPVLDFQRSVEPLIVAEMTEAYYRALLGIAGSRALPDLRPRSETLCAHADSTEDLYTDLDRLHDAYLTAVAHPGSAGARHATALLAELPPHPEHGRAPLTAFVVDWRHQLRPVAVARAGTGHAEHVRARMLWDLACARQGNVRNPWKAAWDGVWRDLRPLVGAAVDLERLAPYSRAYFTGTLLRAYNREVNGAGAETIAKLIALIDAGIVDLGHSMNAREAFAEQTTPAGGSHTVVPVHRVVPGWVLRPAEIVHRDPLYARLVADGHLELGAPELGTPYLRLDHGFHPRQASTSWRAVTILGVPAEGFVFFQLALARPHAPNAALMAVERWARGLAAAVGPGSTCAHPR